jgi:hypothetical protein
MQILEQFLPINTRIVGYYTLEMQKRNIEEYTQSRDELKSTFKFTSKTGKNIEYTANYRENT